jgi:hypothetical protein
MKVLKCDDETLTKPAPLSFEEIKKEEGVYMRLTAAGPELSRLIVLRHSQISDAAVLYYNGHDLITPVYYPSWELCKFVKTDERVYFKVK